MKPSEGEEKVVWRCELIRPSPEIVANPLCSGGLSVNKAHWGNIIEETAEEAVMSNKEDKAAILLDFRAFEIKTLILQVK